MVPSLLFDITGIDLDRVRYDAAEIEQVNPHRGQMRLIDAITHVSEDLTEFVAYKDVQDDEFWVPGHIPGSPIFPGVLMIEAAAQVSSFIYLHQSSRENFMGFAGLEDVKFRGQVVPGDRLYILCKQVEMRRRRSICKAQGLVNGGLAFEATVIGMPMQVRSRSDAAAAT